MKRGPKTNLDKYIPEPNSGCWLWLGSAMPKGYGIVQINSRKVLAHRAMYERERGPIPAGLQVCHKCDIPGCVNPDHLFLGTAADNLADMRAKGRGSKPPRNDMRGEKHGASKLTAAMVVAIRSSTEMGKTLAARYGISPSQVFRLRNRQRWAHIP